ncbi:proline-rich receptor-like protein kinase PERK10 [Drosophila eugracilis]|uniref:proline-rich receptor-like protein kinase PERK10 n=1 Tax=Drosophila eugracilis TaxID=29029 RepID=UPI0007E77C18|nr:proline-rich receptor-like protein kinase PERK10 [Drosophila eugracilis]
MCKPFCILLKCNIISSQMNAKTRLHPSIIKVNPHFARVLAHPLPNACTSVLLVLAFFLFLMEGGRYIRDCSAQRFHNPESVMVGSTRATLLGLLLLILWNGLDGQQLPLARPQRSLYEAPLEHVDHLPPLGWNSVAGGFGAGEWAYSPVGLGHMSKDELLTLLEAWKEVEQESATTTTSPPEETTTRRPPPPPPPPPRPRPIPIPIPMPAPALPPIPQLPSGTPISVRLPAFVPIRLAAVFTPPASGVNEVGAGDVAPGGGDVGEDAVVSDDVPHDDSTPRLFRFMPMPVARTNPQSHSNSQPRQQFVVRNTLDSVDVGTAPVRQQVKPDIKPKATATYPAITKLSSQPAPFFRPRFGVPPHLSNARFELVPSSQIIGDWRE